MKAPQIHIGLSGFNNGYWKGVFYPEDLPRAKWFEYYCRHFETYEINSTFYNFPTVKGLKTWFGKAPDDFLYSVKAHRSITHFKRFVDAQESIDKFYDTIREGLGSKLACVLFQLPPSFEHSAENLELIIASISPDFKNVIEFRNASWWRPDVFDRLEENNISFCSVSYPKLPESVTKTAQTGYVRLHGKTKLFYSGYDQEALSDLLNDVSKAGFTEVFIYFNNTASVAGIENAVALKSQLGVNSENLFGL
jgi:uncharacterized protein YecE (DUF72 family)